MSIVEDPLPWVGDDFFVLAPRSHHLLRSMLTPDRPGLATRIERTARINLSAVNTSLSGPGLLGVVRVAHSTKATGPGSYQSTNRASVQVAIGRLARPIAAPVTLVPYFQPLMDHLEGDGLVANLMRKAVDGQVLPETPDHELLRGWWASAFGPLPSGLIEGDEGLAALLWASRTKVHQLGGDSGETSLRLHLESLIPQAPQLSDIEGLEIRGDRIAITRQTFERDLDDKLMALVEHLTTHFR